MSFQLGEESLLSGKEFSARRCQVEPIGPIDLGKFLRSARAWRPLQCERIAANRGRVYIAFNSPSVDELPTGLLQRLERY